MIEYLVHASSNVTDRVAGTHFARGQRRMHEANPFGCQGLTLSSGRTVTNMRDKYQM